LTTLALPDTGEARYCVPTFSAARRTSAEASSDTEVQSTRIRGALPLADSTPFSPVVTATKSFEVASTVNTMSRPARSDGWPTIVAPSLASGSAFSRVRFHTAMSTPSSSSRCAMA
jgi:hypothetical protein